MKATLYTVATEFKLRLLASVRGFHFWIYLLLMAVCILEGVAKPLEDYETETLYGGYMMLIWGSFLCRGKLGKMLYLLPMEEQEKKRYLFLKAASVVMFESACYLFAGVCVRIISGRSFLVWVEQLFLYMMPYILLLATTVIMPYDPVKREKLIRGDTTPKGILISYAAIVFTVVNAMGYFGIFRNSLWRIPFIVLAYAAALLYDGYTAGLFVKATANYKEGQEEVSSWNL